MSTRYMTAMVALAASASVTAFAPIQPFRRSAQTQNTALQVSWWDSDDESHRAAMLNNILRTDLRNFLTQRSLQSFMHLCVQCRDPHTVKWLEEFGDLQNLENYHGTGALNVTKFPTWSSFLTDLMEHPEDVVVVSAKRRDRGNKGFRSEKENPYVKESVVEFDIDIDPASLTGRILAVREQIAAEWVHDLDTLRVTNDMVLENYNEKIKKARDEEECNAEEEYDHNQVEGCAVSGDESHSKIAFDRNAMFFLRNSNSFCGGKAPSPLRQGSFDLLCLLATQESIHRVLRDYVDAGNAREVSFQWFRDFYVARAAKFFDGNGEYGRADDFLEELLLTPPSVKSSDDGKIGLLDPLRIAENIIETRSKVAMEWKEDASMTKEEHTLIRKELLELQMVKWGRKPAEPELSKEKPAKKAAAEATQQTKEAVINEVEIFGEFQ